MVAMRVLLSNVQFGLMQASLLENYMTSVERLLEYKNLEQEAPLEQKIGGECSYQGWPKEGDLKFNNVCLSYNLGSKNETVKYVLNNVSFHIYPGERVRSPHIF